MRGDRAASVSGLATGSQPNPSPPSCGGRTRDGRPCPVPPTEASGYAWCFRHTPGATEQVSRWASEASQSRDGKLSRRVRKLLKRAELDDLAGVMQTRKALWRCGAAGVITVDRYKALDGTLEDFTAFYLAQTPRTASPLVVEVARFDRATGTEATDTP
jgi:hypothetical protein